MITPFAPAPTTRWSAEFALALACCKVAAGGDTTAEVRAAAGAVDWPTFLSLVERHRIAGLAWRGLERSGVSAAGEAAAYLGQAARGVVQNGLEAAAESQRLSAAFAADSISLLFVKGLCVSALAYGDPFLKMSADIDLLVDGADVGAAAELLGALGYRRTVPSSGNAARTIRWHRRRKESVWVQDARGITLDLHSRLADAPDLLAGVGFGTVYQQVAITPTLTLPTLGNDDLFAYLAVHGASSAWFRLKWIADFQALYYALPPDELERYYDHAVGVGAGRAAGQALLLAQTLFGMEPGVALAERLANDGAHRRLAVLALGQLSGGEPTERRLGTATIHLSQFLLRPGLAFKARELARLAETMIVR